MRRVSRSVAAWRVFRVTHEVVLIGFDGSCYTNALTDGYLVGLNIRCDVGLTRRLSKRTSYMLDLNDLATGNIPAITERLGGMLAEVAGVCLESQGHTPGNATLLVSGSVEKNYQLTWEPTVSDAFRAYQTGRATEDGAVGIAILLANREFEHEVIEASWIGTGFDYWLGDEDGKTFQRKRRLEISGIRPGNERDVNARVNEKLRQMAPSDRLGLTAYVIVVEFSQPAARFVEKQ